VLFPRTLFPLTEALCVVVAALCLLLAVALILVAIIGAAMGTMGDINMVLFLLALLFILTAFYLLRPRSRL
jgi:hypothetical protein